MQQRLGVHMTQDQRAADEHPEQAHPSHIRGNARTADAAACAGQIGPIYPRFDYRLRAKPDAPSPIKRPRRDLGRCLAEMRATMLELGHLVRPDKDHLHT